MFEVGISEVGELQRRLAGFVVSFDPPVEGSADLWECFDRIERLAGAAKMLLASRVDASGAWRDAGCKDAAEFLARLAGTGISTAREALALSARLPRVPRIEKALRAGQVSVTQAAVVADAATVNPAAEEKQLDLAPTTTP